MSLGKIGESGLTSRWLNRGWSALSDYAHSAMTPFQHEDDENSPASTTNSEPDNSVSGWGVVAADVIDHENQIEVRLEIPGMSKAELEVTAVANGICVQGEKQMSSSRKEGSSFVTERAFGRFTRTVPVPVDTDLSSAKATYKDGVLVVTLDKLSSQPSNQIPVH